MSPGVWRESLELVLRDHDGVRLGFLRQVGGDAWEPLNLLGISLGDAGPREDAIHHVTSGGMDSLSQVWWVRAPMPMVESRLDARAVDDGHDWRRMVVVELTPDRAHLRSAIPWPEESGKLVYVDLPAADVLRADEPFDE